MLEKNSPAPSPSKNRTRQEMEREMDTTNIVDTEIVLY